MKQNKILYLLVGAVIIIVLLFGSIMFKLIKQNSECVNNPFIYGAKMTEEKGMPILCTCNSLNPDYTGFSYDKDGIRIQNIYSTDYYNTSLLNLSDIKFYINGDEGGERVPQ